ncbi:GAF domain-containing protein [Microcoleus vaginatus PCC 9802]|uniref:trifunctional serine/threonine-protein kinase/ATP-binding protein/sensor histidine kinase n=1 Tax=Microcoleus vaginatus TaxID=119532 RepID=UPI00020D178F|nr:multi-sensor signal transduction multi-kinase [Microcoleus vaginatus FGP-2]UNU17847.1 GAF domain-containing protein [Microcoleus vaginatus PCC 9802]
MMAIPGVAVLALIYESSTSLVYRGHNEQNNQPVIIKLIKEDYPTPEELNRYKREYEITANLSQLDGVVKVYKLQQVRNSLAMILEDFGGESLKIFMASQKFTILGFLTTAIKVAETLGEIHGKTVIHKDINPSNIVFNPATGQVKLIDFSISTASNLENIPSKNHNFLEGTLAYMSPEQTGRMNRVVDYRTDFYSLGVTFYEILAGQLPFPTTDPMELVHCHIAKQPVPLAEIAPEIPQTVSDIVMKLLAKTPEERYQSAWGLKADLESCLFQWQTSGVVSEFPLGRQDISDKFQIPQKLYGRQREVETLLAAFERVAATNNRGYRTEDSQISVIKKESKSKKESPLSVLARGQHKSRSEMMLIAGYSGIGKSAMVKILDKPITRRRGYFIWGKFDQYKRTIPYSAVVSAFSELVRQLLTESEAQLAVWREKLRSSFGQNGQIIIDVIPEVELIVGAQSPVAELGPTESLNRFNLVFQNFIRVFCQPEHPLVIFLDDLQWADSATLKLIELMMTDEATQYLFLIGAYRDNEVSPTHPLMMTVETLRNQEAIINQIALSPLGVENITHLIAETLHSDRESVKPLAELVISKTDGNPFFVNQFLQTLYQENLLVFHPPQSGSKGGWHWDMTQIEQCAITDNVVDLMVQKLRKLPTSTQQVLRLVACLGNEFDLNTLSLIHEKEASETFSHLLPAIKSGLILPTSELESKSLDYVMFPLLILNYKFLHDRVQQAAYALIDDSQKKAVHLKIGRQILENTPAEYRADRIFELVDHLNVARSLIKDDRELIELATLNLDAARRAKDATAYVAALQYLTAGMDGLSADIWDAHYDLAFALHMERANVEYLNGYFEKSEEFINITLEKARSPLEKVEIYNLLIVQYTLRAKYEEAVKAGIQALDLLGIDLPLDGLQKVISEEFAAATNILAGREIASLIDAPEMTVPDKKVAVKLITNLLTSAYLKNPDLWKVSVLKGVNLSLQYGLVPEASLCYAGYGMFLNAVSGDYKAAYQFGLLSLNLSEKSGNIGLKCRACSSLVSIFYYWFNHIKDSHAISNEGYQAALESGDLEYAGYILSNRIANSFFQGKEISQILADTSRYLQFSQKTKNQLVTDILLGVELILRNLSKLTPEKFVFESEDISEAEYVHNCQAHQNLYSLCLYQIRKCQVMYWYGNFNEALQLAFEVEKQLSFITGAIPATEWNFFFSLTLAAVFPNVSEDKQKEYLEKLEENQKQMKIWADNCAENFLHKYLLVQAEIARISKKDSEAVELYDFSINLAQDNEFVQNEALANELAAKFWLSKGKYQYAKIHLREAHSCYLRWGAVRKVEDLEQKYPQLREMTPLNGSFNNNQTTTTIHTSTGSDARVLDLATVMKASLAISSEIVLDKLLASLMRISLENAGAQLGFLILVRDGQLLISAKASVFAEDVAVLQFTPVGDYHDLPVTVINYVERTRSDLVLSNAAAEGLFTADPYIAKHQLQSILCTPIINQGKLIGILYLENNLTVGAFTPHRLEVLRLLSSQVAISLENALLYNSVEQKVQERTQELNEKNERLEQTLRELKLTQAQLIQTEKMSSLGQMVAGVAHEINNPVSFIYGNLNPASEYVKDLLKLIELYQQHYPEPADEILEEIETIELEFLSEDLQKLLDSMKVGAERIRDIVLSLRNFSRLDEAQMKSVDIHQGIDSTVMLLQPRLRKEGGRLGIEVIKNYSTLPLITCYASQLNQVFMNILTNAIDALLVARDCPENSHQQPTITISTEVTDRNSAIIRIADSGPGMSTEVLHKIFDPFFTTKPVGSGTGLGLSISHSIVVSSHGGKLTCVSAPGEGSEFIIEIPIAPRQVL